MFFDENIVNKLKNDYKDITITNYSYYLKNIFLNGLNNKIFKYELLKTQQNKIIDYINKIINYNKLVDIYKNNKITEICEINILIKLLNIIIILHNNCHDTIHRFIKIECKKIYNNIKTIINNNSGINYF